MSNKTHENSDEKIELVPKIGHRLKIITLIVGVCVCFFAITAILSLRSNQQIIINGKKINIMRVSTVQDREKGLGGRENLNKDQGMLFTYTTQGAYCIWMKDMKFAIDIVWFDSNRRVVSTKSNATPDSYPEAFCPSSDAQYILEIPKGTIDNLDIKTGDQIKF